MQVPRHLSATALVAYQGLAFADPRTIPTTAGLGPISTVEDVRRRFPDAVCKKNQIDLGSLSAQTTVCTATGRYLSYPAQYRISFAAEGLDGVAIHIVNPREPMKVAKEVTAALSASLGTPTDEFLSSAETIKKEGGFAVRWVFRPVALVSVKVCDPDVYMDRLGCREKRVIIDTMYNLYPSK